MQEDSDLMFNFKRRLWLSRVSKLTTIGSDDGLSPSRRQAITGISAGILSIRTLGTHFSAFSFKEMHLKIPSAKLRQLCLELNMFTAIYL